MVFFINYLNNELLHQIQILIQLNQLISQILNQFKEFMIKVFIQQFNHLMFHFK